MTESTREKILNKAKAKIKPLPFSLFGEPVELRRPSIARVLELQDQARTNANDAMLDTIVNCVYPVGEDTPMFTMADKEAIREWAFDTEVQELVNALGKMLNIQVADAEKNSVATLTDTSS